jgi:hypothetical protein
MRALATLALGIVLSWLVAAVIQVAFGIAFDAHEEMVFAMVLEVIIALLSALVFGVVLAARGSRRAVAVAATVMIVLGVVSLAGIEAFALADEAAAINPSDFPLMIEIGVPGVVTVVLQAWLVYAYLRRENARATLVPAEG